MSTATQPSTWAATSRSGGGMLVVAAILLASANFIAVLDMTIANVSVPNIAGSLGISVEPGHLDHHLLLGGRSDRRAPHRLDRGAFRRRAAPSPCAMILFGGFSAFCGLSELARDAGARADLPGPVGRPADAAVPDPAPSHLPEREGHAGDGTVGHDDADRPDPGPILGGSICDTCELALHLLHQRSAGADLCAGHLEAC